MKKQKLLLSLVCLISFVGFGQDFNAGLLGGLNASWLHNATAQDLWTKKCAVQIGLFVDYPLTKKLFLRPELKYLQKGHKNIEADNIRYKVTLHYVEMPILLGYNLSKIPISYIEKYRFFWVSGLSYAYLFKYFENLEVYDNVEKPKSKFNEWDLALQFGLGCRFNNQWTAEIRYASSVLMLRKYNENNIYIAGNQYNRSVNFLVNYFF